MFQSGRHHNLKKKIKRKECWIKSAPRKIRLLYYWGKFLGINPLSLSDENKLNFSYLSMFYGCFLTIVYCFSYYGFMVERKKMRYKQTPIAVIVDSLAISWQFCQVASMWLVSAINQRRMKTIVSSFVTAEKTSKKLGIDDNWDKQLKEFGTHIIITNILFIFSFSFSHTMSHFFTDIDLFVWASFDFPALATFNTGVIFILCLIFVRRKFRRLNETVEFFINGTSSAGPSGLIMQSSRDFNLLLDRINMILQLHRELRNIIHLIEKHFASFVLFSVGNSFTYLTIKTFGIYLYLRGHSRNFKDLMYVAGVSYWIIYSITTLAVLSSVCSSTLNEANNIGGVLHKILNRCQYLSDSEEGVKFNLHFLDLLQNQVDLSVYGLYKLDHSLVYRTLATGTTYLIIMLQIYA